MNDWFDLMIKGVVNRILIGEINTCDTTQRITGKKCCVLYPFNRILIDHVGCINKVLIEYIGYFNGVILDYISWIDRAADCKTE